MKIRKYNNSDWPELVEIFKLNTPVFFNISELEEFKSYLDSNGDTYFIAEQNDNIIGAGGYHISQFNIGRISWYLCDPNTKGRGIGTELVNFNLNKLRVECNIQIVEVWTSQHAYKFFEKFDFEILEVGKNYWAKGIDLYRMMKKLI